MATNKKAKRAPWNKGLTKETHSSLAKTAQTLAKKQKSNFSEWQRKNKPRYVALKKSALLAEFYGVMLGDGCIEKLARTEKLVVTCFSEHKKQIVHVKDVVYKLFLKNPLLRKRKDSRAVDVYLYQKYIARRLKFPTGIKLQHSLNIPEWVLCNNSYLLKCLKGLFETDGDFTIDSHNSTYVLKFSNRSQTLLDDVYKALVGLGYHPQRRQIDVRLARKKEAFGFAKRISFRQY